MSNYWAKQPSSRLLKAQNINWAGTGTAFSTNFLPQTNQIRVISQVAGYISIVPTTSDGTIATTAQVGTFIPVNTAAADYFTVTGGMFVFLRLDHDKHLACCRRERHRDGMKQMPIFDFQAPDGRVHSVEGPAGATPEQAFAILQQHLGNKSPTFDAEGARKAGYSDAEIQGVHKALAAGYSPDEISAHLSQQPPPGFVLDKPTGGKLGTLQGPWTDFQQQAPWTDFQQPPPGYQLDQPGNSLSGSVKAIGSGLAGGVMGLAGQPGDVKNAIFSTLGEPPAPAPAPEGSYGKLVSFLERARSALEFPTSNEVRSAVESKTGSLDYEPRTPLEKRLKTGGEFLPAALNEGSLLRRAALVALPAAGSELAEEAGGGPVAKTIAAVTGAVLSHKLTTPKTIISKPTAQQVEAAGTAGYQDPAITGLKFKGTAIPDLGDSIVADLNKAKFNERLAPQTHAVLDDLQRPVNGSVHTVEDLETTRQLLGKVAGNYAAPVEQAAASKAIAGIDRYLGSIPQNDVLIGNAAAANNALTTARGDYAHAKLAGRVQEKLDNAELQAGSAHSGRNLDNATRQKLRTLLTSNKQGRGLTDEDIALIENNVMGSGVGNTLRSVGNFLGGGGGLGALHAATVGGGGGAMMGGPVGAVLGAVVPPAIGYATKKIGNAITRKNAQAIVENILARSPEGQKWAAMNQRILAANPLLRALPPALLSGLLAVQAGRQQNQ